jgi:hypothetical protein
LPSPQPSQALRRLLETKLDTFEKLELVVVLREAAAAIPLEELARQLQVGPDVLRRVAVELARGGLVAIDGDDKIWLRADDAELELLNEARELYKKDRSQVITLLSAIAMERLRGMSARSFADAFSLRKKKDDDNG